MKLTGVRFIAKQEGSNLCFTRIFIMETHNLLVFVVIILTLRIRPIFAKPASAIRKLSTVGISRPCGAENSAYRCANIMCIPDKWRCDGDNDCGDYSDETLGCEPCDVSNFRCANSLCIPLDWSCDGEDDCGDNSDETIGCELGSCDTRQFRCGDGACIHGSWQCDGENDCDDHSDEENCSNFPRSTTTVRTTPADGRCGIHFWCANDRCVHIARRCDGHNDCGDRSDELACHGNMCDVDYQFLCKVAGWKGACIPVTWMCDGDFDCGDNSDEENCV